MDGKKCLSILTWLFIFSITLPAINASGTADAMHYSIDLTIKPLSGTVYGETTITFNASNIDNLEFRLDDDLSLKSVHIGNIPVGFSREGNKVELVFDRPPWGTFDIQIVYEGSLDVEMDGHSWAYMDEEGAYAVYESFWYPHIVGDRASGTITLRVPSDWMGISNGKLVNSNDAVYTWADDTPDVGFSFAAGNYMEMNTHVGHLPVTCYLIDPRGRCDGRFDEIMDFFSTTLSEYPFPKLAIVEVKGNLNGGHSDHSLVILSSNIMNSPQFEEYLAHEISHNWFGSVVTAKDVENRKDQWITEGFATYLSVMYLDSMDGSLALKSLDAKRREYVFMKETYGDIPLSAVKDEHDGKFVMNDGMIHATVYSKGAWVLHMLRYVVGDETFLDILKTYLDEYQWKSASIEDFRLVAETISDKNLGWFFSQWMDSTVLPDFLVDSAEVMRDGGEYTTVVKLKQGRDVMKTPLDVTLTISSTERYTRTVWMDSESLEVTFQTKSEPVFVEVDKDGWLLEREKSNNRHIIRYPLNFYGIKMLISNLPFGG